MTKVLVMGDIMLDQYYFGTVERVSPEAPIPVVAIKSKKFNLGGAGNVAMNVVGLGYECILVGICGDDEAGKTLINLIQEARLKYGLLKIKGRQTTIKTRIIGNGQHIVRVDEEETNPVEKSLAIYDSEFNIANQPIMYDTRQFSRLDSVDVVILSDYAKGLLSYSATSDIIRECRERNIPVFIDPKGKNWERYKGATCLTPNLKEFNQIGYSAEELIKYLGLEYLVITKGAKGLELHSKNSPTLNIPALAKEVADVSGAGDTVIATIASKYASGSDMIEAVKLANKAASIVVGKIGAQPITYFDLQTEKPKENKIFSISKARHVITQWKNEGKSIVFTNGCFDILHTGHIEVLNTASGQGDKLIVGLNSDESITILKGTERPIKSEHTRAAILASMTNVDMVIVFEEDTPLNLIETIKPDVIVKGGDYTPENIVGADVIKQYGGKVVIVPLVSLYSTTNLINRIKSDEVRIC